MTDEEIRQLMAKIERILREALSEAAEATDRAGGRPR